MLLLCLVVSESETLGQLYNMYVCKDSFDLSLAPANEA